jgi:cobalt-zinc-cadmium resistance protein CzcA
VDNVPTTFGPDDRFSGIKAGITLPLWFVPYTARAKAAKINEEVAVSDAENFSKYMSARLKTLVDEYKKFSASVEFYEKNAVPEADLIIEQSSKSYRAGALDYLEYVLSLNRALEIKQKYLEAVSNLNQTIINIEYITGQTL